MTSEPSNKNKQQMKTTSLFSAAFALASVSNAIIVDDQPGVLVEVNVHVSDCCDCDSTQEPGDEVPYPGMG